MPIEFEATEQKVAILQEKADQVLPLLQEFALDCWLIFARETSIHPDPGVELVVGADVVRNSAFLFGRNGERIAIVAQFDTAAVRDMGVFAEVFGYDQDILTQLVAALQRIAPQSIGLNFSTDDVTADGLTHGQWLLLQQMLRETPFGNRMVSAAPLLKRLRGRKTLRELALVRQAVTLTEEIVQQIDGWVRPGLTENELAEMVHAEFRRRDLLPAWSWETCPIVNAGPHSNFGHACPSRSLVVQPGHLVHVDLGVKWQGYCSDLQRTWYVCRPGESQPPVELQLATGAVCQAIDSAANALRPGVAGHLVDAAARRAITAAGYAEFQHAVGHGLGRAVHDGGTLLGPQWPCYGATVCGSVEEDNVFTLELSVLTSAGCVGLEEDIRVTRDGCEFLSDFRRELRLVRS